MNNATESHQVKGESRLYNVLTTHTISGFLKPNANVFMQNNYVIAYYINDTSDPSVCGYHSLDIYGQVSDSDLWKFVLSSYNKGTLPVLQAMILNDTYEINGMSLSPYTWQDVGKLMALWGTDSNLRNAFASVTIRIDRIDPSNYDPISLLTDQDQLFEVLNYASNIAGGDNYNSSLTISGSTSQANARASLYGFAWNAPPPN